MKVDKDADVTMAGNLQVDSTLTITGQSTFTGQLNANGGIDADSGKFTVGNDNGNVLTQGTLEVDGATQLDGDVTLGNAAADNIVIPGTIKPSADDVVPVRIEGLQDQSVNLLTISKIAPSAGPATVSSAFTVDQNGNAVVAGTITSGNINSQTIGSPASFTGDVTIGGTLTVSTAASSAGHIGYIGSSSYTQVQEFTSSATAGEAFTTTTAPKFHACSADSGLRVNIAQNGVYLVTGSVTISATGLQEVYAVLKMGDQTGITKWNAPAFNAKGADIASQKVNTITAIDATCPSSINTFHVIDFCIHDLYIYCYLMSEFSSVQHVYCFLLMLLYANDEQNDYVLTVLYLLS